jgi:predicted PurR-regulated permease PerM
VRAGRRESDRVAGGIGYFLFFLTAFLGLTILLIWPVFPYVVVAILLAYLFHPVNRHLATSIRSPAMRAGLLTFAVILLFALPLAAIVQRVTRELGPTFQPQRARELMNSARVWLAEHDAQVVADWAVELLVQGRDYLANSIPSLFGSVFQITLGIFVCLFVFYYFTKEGESFWHTFVGSLPLPGRLRLEMSREVAEIVRAIFFGQLLTAVVQGLLGGVGLVVFQVPQPVLLTLLMILLAFFPFVGATLVWGPAAALKLMAGETWQGVGLLIYGAVVVMNVDNVLKPRLIARHSRVHPVVILIGIIGGTQIFGFIGILLGPLIFAIFLQLLRFFGEYRSQELIEPSDQTAQGSGGPPPVRAE